MSRFVLLLLTVSLLKNEVECGTLGKISKSDGSLLPRAERELPSHWTRLNLELPARNKVSVNTIGRIKRDVNTTSKRQAKFLPKFSILAGLDIGGGLTSRTAGNIAPNARISQANTLPGIINPYFAASYDPFPSNVIQQSVETLYRLVERLAVEVDGLKKKSNNSAESVETVFVSDDDINAASISDKRTRKDKFKIKKSSSKRKKQDDDEEYEDEEKKQASQKVEKFQQIKSTKKGVRKNTNAKQAVPVNTTNTDIDTDMEISMEVNGTDSNTTTDQGTNTYPQSPGYYYGGNPQNIGGVGFTYDPPKESYGPPSSNYPPSSSYGSPSYSYGSPSQSYGSPSQSYGSPSYSYGPPSQSYGSPSYPQESAHYTSFHDDEHVYYNDPNDDSFGPIPSTRWRQRLPFARSQKLTATTRAPTLPNTNGFVPI